MKKIVFCISLAAIFLVNSNIHSQENPEGFGNVKWGTNLNDTKPNIIGKIKYTDEKKIIISKDGDIEYLYGFFYVEPVAGGNQKKENNLIESDTKPDAKATNSKLFYVSVKFPYLTIDEVKKKIEEKYGSATGEDIKNNKGAIVWDSNKTTIIMWVDNYEGAPFCMKINYVSKELAKEVNDYQKIIFNSIEMEVLKRLSL